MIRLAFLFLAWVVVALPAAAPPNADPLPEGARLRIGTARLRHGGLIRALAFSSDGNWLVSGGHDRTLSLWEVPSGREKFRCRGHTGDVTAVAFAPGGELLASASTDGTVRLWAARGGDAGKLLHVFELSGNAITSLAFAPRGSRLAAGGDDGVIRLIDVVRRTVVSRLRQDYGVPSLAFSPDGKRLAVALGAVVYRAVIAAALFIGLGPTDMRLVTSVIVVVALAVPRFRALVTPRSLTVAPVRT